MLRAPVVAGIVIIATSERVAITLALRESGSRRQAERAANERRLRHYFSNHFILSSKMESLGQSGQPVDLLPFYMANTARQRFVAEKI
jgi:hypothetical protein